MALTAGIVGLPNVGKSTLFNAITKSKVEAANYPFATIEPNVGVVEVPDPRLDVLTNMVGPDKKIPTHFEFTDIAGIVKGASEGEGLGNQFLANIREVDAICHVVRCFEDENITHVDGRVDPAGDIDTINTELALADLESAEKQYDRVKKKAKSKDAEAMEQAAVLEKIIPVLEEGGAVRTIDFSDDEKKIVRGLFFLTAKPVLYVANIAEDEIQDASANPHVQAVQAIAEAEGTEVITVSARIEEEIAGLDEEDQEMFLEDLGLDEPGLNVLIRAAYSMLGLGTFFTVGEKECRAWTFKKGMTAPQAAGVIHSDFERGFIRAETVSYDDYVQEGGAKGAREAGKYRSEGKDYIVKDGDIMLFRFNV